MARGEQRMRWVRRVVMDASHHRRPLPTLSGKKSEWRRGGPGGAEAPRPLEAASPLGTCWALAKSPGSGKRQPGGDPSPPKTCLAGTGGCEGLGPGGSCLTIRGKGYASEYCTQSCPASPSPASPQPHLVSQRPGWAALVWRALACLCAFARVAASLQTASLLSRWQTSIHTWTPRPGLPSRGSPDGLSPCLSPRARPAL